MPLTSPSTITRSRASGAWPTKRRLFPKSPDQKNGTVVKGWYWPSMFRAANAPAALPRPSARSSRASQSGRMGMGRVAREQGVNHDGAILVEGDTLHEPRVGQHARADDDRVRGQDLAVLQLHPVHDVVATEEAHLRTPVPLNALLPQQPRKRCADLLAEHTLKGHGFHGDDGHLAAPLLQGRRNLHADEGAAHHNHLQTLPGKLGDLCCILRCPQSENSIEGCAWHEELPRRP
eukprot:CAMPEP_0175474574 /NCGR_PEP_ID=MMETSP0095-20121207/74964_1 /TAXON_ID=311494 /ORGANISM="Alexandrium monilatum, Strain CCMP3105" /LENGTH=233 /DNA_ID=CAMNT_0016776099 /DNA_START=115 /DNA_END=813 /DNA_ORIENTATION=-